MIVLAAILAFIGVKYFGLDQYLTFEYIKSNQEQFKDFYQHNQFQTILYYFIIYVATTALSIPGATVLTLLAGALFGFINGLIIVSFASTLGATLAFLISRTVLRDWVEKKYGNKLKTINDGVQREGAFYLFTLRLVPIVPFFVINLAMGLTKMSVWKFFFVSQIGMLAGTAVYVNAGVQLSELEGLGGIFSTDLLISFTLLGIFPLIAKKILNFIKARKVYKGWSKPRKYDYNMIVIGAGSAGLVTSYICAAVKASVLLVEKEKMGGDCLNTGCVPSKALIKSAKVAKQVQDAHKFGVNIEGHEIDFAKAMGRVHDVIAKIEPHDSVERYTKLGVECKKGTAKFITPWEVEINGERFSAKNITIATGASPMIPPIKGIEHVDILHSNNLWELKERPQKLVILGGGPIGLEMAQAFTRLGSEVTLVEMADRIIGIEDPDVSELVTQRLTDEGVKILTKHKAVEFKTNTLICENDSKSVELAFDKVLVAVGRSANIKDFGLDELGIQMRDNGTIWTNEFLQTNFPHIYACGDVTGPFQLTHAAAHQAWHCAVNALFGSFKRFKVDYSFMPWCTYTDPEMASVGKNETRCQKEGIEYEVTKYGLDDLDRAIADSSDYGFVKVITKKGSDKILGVTIVGVNAGELLTEFVTNMKHGKGLNAILGTIHSYPTMAEANKFAAGNWKQNHKPEKLLGFVSKFHQWRRS